MRSLVLLVALSACTSAPLLHDAGVDAGFVCRPATVPADAGPGFSVFLTLCPREGSLFLTSRFFTVLASDGGVIASVRDTCSSCDRCPALAICDPDLSVLEVEAETQVSLVDRIDGRLEAGSSTCSGTGEWCAVRTALPAGDYRVRWCVSRSASRDERGAPRSLGPLECVERPFSIPFEVPGLAATFE